VSSAVGSVLQAAFAAALLHPSAAVPRGVASPRGGNGDRRFAIYRSNVAAGLIAALESRFPVVLRLVGREFFRGMARLYVELDPPRSPLLFRYGSRFPFFIESFPPAEAFPYLADVARLEFARGAAYHAADAAFLPAGAFAALDSDSLAATGVRLHPSVALLTSRFPVVSIWEAHQGSGAPVVRSWGGESALVARPAHEVEIRRLPAGGYEFLSALDRGASLTQAAATAAAASAGFDSLSSLRMLIEARIAARLVAVA
jgi:hypothetical protein